MMNETKENTERMKEIENKRSDGIVVVENEKNEKYQLFETEKTKTTTRISLEYNELENEAVVQEKKSLEKKRIDDLYVEKFENVKKDSEKNVKTINEEYSKQINEELERYTTKQNEINQQLMTSKNYQTISL